MRAEVIAIGDELTSGQRVDTNSAWISQRLGEIGIRVLHHSTVADDIESCRAVFREAFERVEIIVCTGGLGPTADDLTRQVIAEAMDVPLEQDDAALKHIREMFTSRGREMPPNNAIQAMFPSGSRIVPNPHGTAPGIDVSIVKSDGKSEARCFALPGVPVEMKEMWQESVQPALQSAGAAKQVIVHHELKCFGIGESDCERRLPDLVRRGREPSVGITVHRATITLRMTAAGESVEACRQKIQPTVTTIRECLGDIVFGEGDVTLYEVVLQMLANRKQKLVTAEWGTDGILAHSLCSVAGADAVLGGSLVAPGQACRLPWVMADGVTADGVMPTEEASLREFAEQIREQSECDFALVVGDWGRAEIARKSDSTDQPSEQLTIVLATKAVALTLSVPRRGHPDIIPERTAKLGLDLLRKHLLGT